MSWRYLNLALLYLFFLILYILPRRCLSVKLLQYISGTGSDFVLSFMIKMDKWFTCVSFLLYLFIIRNGPASACEYNGWSSSIGRSRIEVSAAAGTGRILCLMYKRRLRFVLFKYNNSNQASACLVPTVQTVDWWRAVSSHSTFWPPHPMPRPFPRVCHPKWLRRILTSTSIHMWHDQTSEFGTVVGVLGTLWLIGLHRIGEYIGRPSLAEVNRAPVRSSDKYFQYHRIIVCRRKASCRHRTPSWTACKMVLDTERLHKNDGREFTRFRSLIVIKSYTARRCSRWIFDSYRGGDVSQTQVHKKSPHSFP